MSLLIRQSVVLTMERGGPAPAETDILVEEDRIAGIGQDLVARDPRQCEVIDGRGKIALPGFVNAHIHLWQGGLRGIAGNWTLQDYFVHMLAGIAGRMTPEDVRIGNLIGAWEQIDNGITTIFDWSHSLHTPEHADAALEALSSAGIRAIFGHGPPGNDAASGGIKAESGIPKMRAGWRDQDGSRTTGCYAWALQSADRITPRTRYPSRTSAMQGNSVQSPACTSEQTRGAMLRQAACRDWLAPEC
jgi:cytosine/adenosine deaminase-related metal-dependent hydrolase